ncbi:MAG TPA: hypothetical protein VH025_05860 [Solirubrobacteraceae bacterium]|nr:hypothetical protein [Solirubrobacteraceae bacterium]
MIVGESTTLSGRLTCADNADLAEKAVSLYVHARSAARIKASGETTTTATDGTFQLTTSPLAVDTKFTAIVAGASPAHLLVKVAPQITLSAPVSGQATASASVPRAVGKTTFTGATSPALAGARVSLQVSSVLPDRAWHPVAYARIDSTGHFSLTHRFKIPGEISVRAAAHSGRLTSPAISEPLAYEVPQPQASAVTIRTSADPVSYGESATISGTATGAGGGSVTLLARTGAGGFTSVAKTTADSLGAYSFTETPSENTYYEVSSAAGTSATLFEGVAFTPTTPAQPAGVHAGEQLSLTGTALPALPGQVVYLERKSTSGAGFHVVATGTVTDSLSDYSISYTPAGSGASVMRIRVAGDAKHLTGFGEPFSVTVSP